MKTISFASHISWQILPNQKMGFAYNIREKKYYEFENTELVIWNFLANKYETDEESVIEEVARFYKIDKNIIRNDIESFLDTLYERGLLKINGTDKY